MTVGVIWDLDDEPDGNVQHCAEHGISKEEVEEILDFASDHDVSRSSGRAQFSVKLLVDAISW